MNEDLKKSLSKDPNGLVTYEYIANHINELDEETARMLVDNITLVDTNGQFAVSTARYLNALDKERYAEYIDLLIKHAISSDREHKYIIDLLASIWGDDYEEHVRELNVKDDNFRRIYKRIYDQGL